MLLAHPLTEAAELGVAPATLGVAAAVLLLLLAALAGRTGRPAGGGTASDPEAALGDRLQVRLDRPLGRGAVLGHAVAGGLLVLAVAAGRAGDPDQFANIAPALVIGAGWPAVLVLGAVAGRTWAVANPFDALARPLERLAGRPDRPHVGGGADGDGPDRLDRVAVLGALGWTWWLALWQPGLAPRAVGLVLGLYALVTLAGCTAAGRPRWLAHAEVATVGLGALEAARRGPVQLTPAHRTALAVLLGGLAAAEIRFSRWYLGDAESLGLLPFSEPAALLAYAGCLALGLASTAAAWRWARRTGATDAVATVLPWLVVGVGLSAAVERDRLWTSAQLVLARASNPFGGDVDLFGTADLPIRAWAAGDVARLALQLVVLLLPSAVGVVLAARRHGRRADPAVVLAAGWALLATLSAATR